MIDLSFVVSLPLFIIAVAIFGYGLIRNDERASRTAMSTGLGVGLLGVLVAAIMFVCFSL